MQSLKCVAVGLALLAMFAATPAAAQDSAVVDWLFVLRGELTQTSDTMMSLCPDPQVVAFTDRPKRLARLMDVPILALAWVEGGPAQAAPPNASLVNEADGEIAVIEIGDLARDAIDVAVTLRRLEGILPAVGERIALTIDGLDLSSISKLLNPKALKSLKSLKSLKTIESL